MKSLALVLVTGCSFMASTTPPGHTKSCMPDRQPAHTDTAVVVLAALVGAAIGISAAGGCNGAFGCVDQVAYGAIDLVVATPYVASMIYGYAKDECPKAASLSRTATTPRRSRAAVRSSRARRVSAR